MAAARQHARTPNIRSGGVISPCPATPSRKCPPSTPRGTPRGTPAILRAARHTPIRKASAPPKLISAFGGSLESLPDTVTVRRKVSAPVRSSNNPSSYNPSSFTNSLSGAVKRASPTSSAEQRKKVPAPAKLGGSTPQQNQLTVPYKISRDHGGSAPQNKAEGAPVKGKKGTKGITKATAKGMAEIMPIVKEDKKRVNLGTPIEECVLVDPRGADNVVSCEDLSGLSGKTSPSLPSLDSRTATPSETLLNEATSSSASTASTVIPLLPTPLAFMPSSTSKVLTVPLSVPDPRGIIQGPERADLDRTVSDLIRNNEGKKQEIAALKMEINRLKEAARHSAKANDNNHHCKHGWSSGADTSDLQSGILCCCGCSCDCGTSQHVDCGTSSQHNTHPSVVCLQRLGASVDASPLSDQQKEMLRSTVSSAVSASTQGGACSETLSSLAGCDWDNKSSSSVSEVSVACLQGRILQMEETHYSTSEELQATLQELEDLREQLTECHVEAQQMQEEKQVILESLTQQTEKLTEARGYNDTLKLMLIQHAENSEEVSQCERTQRLMELLKSVQEDKELVQLRQEEVEQQMHASRQAEQHFHSQTQLIRERMKMLECLSESAAADKSAAEVHLTEAREAAKTANEDSERLRAQLIKAKEKITDLEAAVISGEKSELAGVLERVCADKESSEAEVARLQRILRNKTSDNEGLKEQAAGLQENLRVLRNNAKTSLDDVECRRSQLVCRATELETLLEEATAKLQEATATGQRHLADKRELKAALSEAQKKASESVDRSSRAEASQREQQTKFERQTLEWHSFERDLLTSVRVANDFKTESQRALHKAEAEAAVLSDTVGSLRADVERLSRVNLGAVLSLGAAPLSGLKAAWAKGGDRSPARPLARGDSRVKNLIESIESATKHSKSGSRSSSASSLASNGSDTAAQAKRRHDNEAIMIRPLPTSLSISPLKESLSNTNLKNSYSKGTALDTTNLPDTVKMSQLDNVKMSQLSAPTDKTNGSVTLTKSQPVSILSNKLEPIRRNSYSQNCLSEKKDPLASLSQGGGSKRNALLKWCQQKTLGYRGVDITNFSSSWNDGLALCALLHQYLPDKVSYEQLVASDKRENFEVAFTAAESVGIDTTLDICDMVTLERPSWQSIFNYVTSIYSHFET